jgi:hypothetical protein
MIKSRASAKPLRHQRRSGCIFGDFHADEASGFGPSPARAVKNLDRL